MVNRELGVFLSALFEPRRVLDVQPSNRLIEIGMLTVAALSAIRLLPHIVVLILSPKRDQLWADLDRFGEQCDGGKPRSLPERIILFVKLMTFHSEYRNVFYFRHRTLAYLLGLLCPPEEFLMIDVKTCGSGLFIQHGYGTLISADEIGAHCWINQMVSVDSIDNSGKRPKIGNNVTIAAGARVLGAVTIGDNAFISANSLVISDIPPGVTVVGIPAKIVFAKKAM